MIDNFLAVKQLSGILFLLFVVGGFLYYIFSNEDRERRFANGIKSFMEGLRALFGIIVIVPLVIGIMLLILFGIIKLIKFIWYM